MKTQTKIQAILPACLIVISALSGCDDHITDHPCVGADVTGAWDFVFQGGQRGPFDDQGRYEKRMHLVYTSETEVQCSNGIPWLEGSIVLCFVELRWDDMTDSIYCFMARLEGRLEGDRMYGIWTNLSPYRPEIQGTWSATKPTGQ